MTNEAIWGMGSNGTENQHKERQQARVLPTGCSPAEEVRHRRQRVGGDRHSSNKNKATG